MLSIRSRITDTAFHLAAEEFLLKERVQDFFMIWQSPKAIVVGKHQNAFAEVNHKAVSDNQVDIYRRLSGGGTVYHDSGNVNFTFIRNSPPGSDKKIEFKEFTDPILRILKRLDIEAVYNGRNDLLIDGLKFSGNAEHFSIVKKRTLHHGTLLFSSNLSHLNESLKSPRSVYMDKAVKSNRSEVTNIASHLSVPMRIDEFIDFLWSGIFQEFTNAKEYEFSSQELTEIEQLKSTKYDTWEWNFGYSPRFELRKSFYYQNSDGTIVLLVERGIISKLEIDHPATDIDPILKALNAIVGCRLQSGPLDEIIRANGLQEVFQQIGIGNSIELFN